jgi:hypothetical protein
VEDIGFSAKMMERLSKSLTLDFKIFIVFKNNNYIPETDCILPSHIIIFIKR